MKVEKVLHKGFVSSQSPLKWQVFSCTAATKAASIVPPQCSFVETRMRRSWRTKKFSSSNWGSNTLKEFGSLTENEWKTGSDLRAYSSESEGIADLIRNNVDVRDELLRSVWVASTSNIKKKQNNCATLFPSSYRTYCSLLFFQSPRFDAVY